VIKRRRPGLRFIRIVLIASVALAAAGCGLVSGATEAPGLDIQYMRHAGSGFLDQVLSIDNHRGDQSAIPTLTIHALDNAGNALPGVSVEGLFGSTSGGLLVPPGNGGYDILRLTGDRATDTYSVSVDVTSIRWVDSPNPPAAELKLRYLAADGSEVTATDRFASVEASNPNDFAVKVDMLYVVWNQPPTMPQQAHATARVPGPLTIPAGGKTTVPIGAQVQAVMDAAGASPDATLRAVPVP
jgi:hypothetical protein